jgi:hypothetical protein
MITKVHAGEHGPIIHKGHTTVRSKVRIEGSPEDDALVVDTRYEGR